MYDQSEWTEITDSNENGHVHVASYKPATWESVEFTLAAPVDGPNDLDGRSDWQWFRLADGTLILGVMPHGDTYFHTEGEHS